MYAIVQSGGKQYKVAPGDVVRVERLEAKLGEKVELTQVLLVQDQDRLLEFLEEDEDYFEMLGRMTSWLH